MTTPQPPQWARRFLRWYCNPDLLEEIQGDATELFTDRLKNLGPRHAKILYIWDVLRFFRWSNIRRTLPGLPRQRTPWGLHFKMSARYASRHTALFGVKTFGLALCFAFSLLLAAFMVNELTFDHFNENFQRIYRVTSRVAFQDQVTNYAVSPLPLGPTLMDKLPEVENYTRFMYTEKPIFRLDDNLFYDEETYAADTTFLKFFTFDFIEGDPSALDEPNKVVLTESTAKRFFGEEDPMGKSIEFSNIFDVEVAGVIKDVPSNSHLQFNALISWASFGYHEDWDNLNAYTYILLRPGSTLAGLEARLPPVLSTFYEMIKRQFQATYQPVFQPLADIHFSGYQDEDVAKKTNKSNLPILVAVVLLFLVTGLVNYLNLSLAELTASLKKIGIIKTFGGIAGSPSGIVLADTIFTLLMVLPLAAGLAYWGWVVAANYLSIHLNPEILTNRLFVGIAAGFILVLVVSSRLNVLVLSKATRVIQSLKGSLSPGDSGTRVRKFLVGMQLAFSIIMIALIFVVVDQFHYIRSADKGFDERNTVAVKLRWGEQRHVEAFMEALRKESGVTGVGESSYYPGVVETKWVFDVESDKGLEQQLVPMMYCDYDYLEALGIRLVAGRSFDRNRPSDRTDAYIINETAAHEFGWKNPIGKRIRGPVSGDNDASREGTVIGVVQDFNFASLHNRIAPLIIFLTDGSWGGSYVYVKTAPVHARNMVSRIGAAFKTQWPDLPFEWEYLDAKYLHLYEKDTELKDIFQAGLIVSILISCMGIFSISALLVSLRTREMGIRKVVGANPVQLFVLHTQSFLRFLIVSVLVAWPVSWYLSREWLQTFAYHVPVTVWYFILPALITLLITVFTSGYHGIMSARVNPVEVLKHE